MASSTVPVSDHASSSRRRLDGWIISPLWDTAFFLAPPLLALIPILWLDPSQFDSAQSLLLMLAVIAAGHHVPGFIRAYSDPELMARYRGRMWLAPPLLIAAALLCEFREIQGMPLLILVWGVWHVVMQNYGLLRIYGAKKSEPYAGTALLDWLVVFTWIAAVYLNNPNWSYRLQWSIYDMGLPFLPTQAFPTVATLALFAAAGSTLLHVLALIRQIKSGQPVSFLKYSLLISNVVFFVVAFSVTNSVVFVAVLVEFLHDLQYYAVGWIFQLRLAEKQRERRPLMSLLFRPQPSMLLVYVGACLFYGVFVSDFGRTFLDAEGVLFKVTRGLLTAATIFHFYSDGFIWKVRQARVRQYLGIEREATGAAPPMGPDAVTKRRSLVHFCCYAALLAVLLIEHRQRTPRNLEIAEYLVQEFPQLGAAHHTLGFELQSRGQHGQAIRELLLAKEFGVIDPVELRQRLGSSFQVVGEFDRAIAFLRESLAMAPEHKRPRVAGQLALLLAECPNPNLRNAAEAVRLAESALPVEGPLRPLFLDILASSYQSAGRTKDAQKTATLALQEARQLGQEQLCQHIAARLNQLTQSESSRQSP